jgi:hypothetical protein
MSSDNLLGIEDVTHLLIRDRVIVRELTATYGKSAAGIIAQLKAQRPLEIPDLDPDLYDCLRDALYNEARTYRTFESDAAFDDVYHIEIMGLGGVYFLRANEFGPVCYFASLEAAETGMYEHWDGVVLRPAMDSPRRRPFGSRSKDAARPTRRPPQKTGTSKRTRASNTKALRRS